MTQANDTRNWNTRGEDKAERLAAAAGHLDGKLARREAITDILYACIRSGDRVIAEGNNQKQADFLSRALGELDPERVNNLHMIQPSVGRPEHLAVFEKGIAKKLDFAFSGTQSHRIGALMMDGTIEVGAIHTYIELYARLFVDLTPRVVLTAAFKADRQGNLYTGPSTEDTPALVEAAAFSDGIVIAQANEIVDDVSQLDRVDIPGSWVDIVVEADRPFYIEPLFTRDPRAITPVQIFMAMMAIKGIYAEHGVTSLNHGIGFNTAAIELLLPTFGEKLGLRGRIAKNWVLNPHPTLIPAIESGWVESVHCFGTELGMERYVAARPDVFFTGARRFVAIQSRVLSAGRAVRSRHVHRRHATDRSRRQFLDRDRIARFRLRRRAQSRQRRARPASCHAGLGQSGATGRQARARTQAGGPDGRDVPGRAEADLRRRTGRGEQSPEKPIWPSRRSWSMATTPPTCSPKKGWRICTRPNRWTSAAR